MSDRVDWVTCPRCGREAALGWTLHGVDSGPGSQIPTEYDCPSGCELADWELRAAFLEPSD
jgi:hypothetical protein